VVLKWQHEGYCQVILTQDWAEQLFCLTIELTGNAAPGELVAPKAKSVTGASGPVQRFVRPHDCELSETHAPIR